MIGCNRSNGRGKKETNVFYVKKAVPRNGDPKDRDYVRKEKKKIRPSNVGSFIVHEITRFRYNRTKQVSVLPPVRAGFHPLFVHPRLFRQPA